MAIIIFFIFYLGDVYTILDQVSFWSDFIPVPYPVTIFVFMMPTKITFQNKFILVVSLD